jgi:hypothetical protein
MTWKDMKPAMKAFGMDTELERLEGGLCPFCGEVVEEADFKHEADLEEYRISGLCKKCQDKAFGEPEKDLG